MTQPRSIPGYISRRFLLLFLVSLFSLSVFSAVFASAENEEIGVVYFKGAMSDAYNDNVSFVELTLVSSTNGGYTGVSLYKSENWEKKFYLPPGEYAVVSAMSTNADITTSAKADNFTVTAGSEQVVTVNLTNSLYDDPQPEEDTTTPQQAYTRLAGSGESTTSGYSSTSAPGNSSDGASGSNGTQGQSTALSNIPADQGSSTGQTGAQGQPVQTPEGYSLTPVTAPQAEPQVQTGGFNPKGLIVSIVVILLLLLAIFLIVRKIRQRNESY